MSGSDDLPNDRDLEHEVSADIEEHALDAWRDDAGDLEHTNSIVDSIIEAGFSDSVMAAMAADTSVSLHVAESTSAGAPAPASTERGTQGKRGWSRMAAGLLVGGALAGAATWSLTLPPDGSTDEPSVSAQYVESSNPSADDSEPDALGRPNFRAEGTPGAPMPEDLDDAIASYVADYGADWGPAFRFHGTIAVARGDALVYAQGFGSADAQRPGALGESPAKERHTTPNGPDTRYRLGLLTEQFTAAAVLQLRDKGDLSLEDNVSKFFQDYPRGSEITVGQLLAHTSGIPNYTALPYFHTWKNEPHTTQQMLARFSKLPLEFTPGTDFSPSNANFYLLGAIVERVSGQGYGEYVQEHLFAAADMERSSFGDAYDTGEQAYGQVWNDEELLDPPDPIDMSVFGGAGGLVSSATDLVRWNAALHGGKVLSKPSVAEMTTSGAHGYGYGLAVNQGYGQDVLSFPAAIDGFNGSMIYFVDDATTVLVLCNTEVVPATRVAQDVAMLVYGDEPQRRREAHEVKIAPSTYPRYIGTYALTEDTWSRYVEISDPERFKMLQKVHVRAYGERLYFDVPGHGLTWMHPMGHGRFFFKDHSGNRVTFDLDAKKSARGMTLHSKNAEFAFVRQ